MSTSIATISKTIKKRHPAVYESRLIKRNRRTRNEIETIKAEAYAVLQELQPATVRQTFYALTVRGIIPKTERGYQDVVRLLTQMRRAGNLPFDWLADNTRWMRKPRSYGGLQHLLDTTASTYRRSVWDNQGKYVEVWLEKDALAGVVFEVTAEFDVPLMVTRGYPSLTFLHSAAEAIAAQAKPTWIYYFGDLDPSGVDIPRKVEAGIREFAPDVDLHFVRMAVNHEQIKRLSLPTRPTKKTDSRAKGFDAESVELDAIPPDELRRMVRWCIEHHIDQAAVEVLRTAEQSEREYLERLAATLGDSQNE